LKSERVRERERERGDDRIPNCKQARSGDTIKVGKRQGDRLRMRRCWKNSFFPLEKENMDKKEFEEFSCEREREVV